MIGGAPSIAKGFLSGHFVKGIWDVNFRPKSQVVRSAKTRKELPRANSSRNFAKMKEISAIQ